MAPLYRLVGGPDRVVEAHGWLHRARVPIIVALAISSWGPLLLFAVAAVAALDLLL